MGATPGFLHSPARPATHSQILGKAVTGITMSEVTQSQTLFTAMIAELSGLRRARALIQRQGQGMNDSPLTYPVVAVSPPPWVSPETLGGGSLGGGESASPYKQDNPA